MSRSTQDDSNKPTMRQELDTLLKEMEVVGHAESATGQLRRKMPKEQSAIRNKKRRVLDKADAEELAIEASETDSRRLRGSKAAAEDTIIEGSLVFPRNRKDVSDPSTAFAGPAQHVDSTNTSQDGQALDEMEANSGSDGSESGDDNSDENDEKEGNEDAPITEPETPRGSTTQKVPTTSSRKRKRRMYRLKNFQSMRMADRHGEALAAHARGQPQEAIRKLKQIAKDVPSAPQVYSSLGMVYEDMLLESRSRSQKVETSLLETEGEPTEDETIPSPHLAEQLLLAKRAYGSYHVAAILCKKDFTLWVRAADAGADVAQIHGQAMLLPSVPPATVEYHRSEMKRWQSEALRDFIVADALKPPGIDVPAKLAAMHMELGNLSEALTILTDLKNKEGNNVQFGRGEFQSSYKAWLLYGDLMLRIGHECIQWNHGVKSNDNYMFRRWLRKFSSVFDWQERRLQALSLALEAATGTKSMSRFMEWMRQRSLSGKTGRQSSENGTQLANADETAQDKAANVEQPNEEVELSEPWGVKNAGIGNNERPDKLAATTDAAEDPEAEKELLLSRNRSELEAFDKVTKDMDLVLGSIQAKDREAARTDMLKSHADAIAAESLDGGKEGTQSKEASDVFNEEVLGSDEAPLPMSASCRQVCSIASVLMKHLHGLELYTGVRLVGESVSEYLKARVAQHDKRVASMRRLDSWQQRLSESPFLVETYDENNIDDDSDGEERVYLSDDEDLDGEDSVELRDSLRRGALPPELRVLFGFALVADGGRNFLAANCIEAINDLDQEPSEWLTEGGVEAGDSKDALWFLFRRAMTEPLGRTSAYAFLADVLRRTGKAQDWSVHFSPWFGRHIETLKEVGLMDSLMGLRGELTPFVNFRKNQLLKIVLAAAAFDIDAAESPSKQSPVNRKSVSSTDTERVKKALAGLTSLSNMFYLMWKVDSDGSLSPICTEVVRTASRYLKWFSRDAKELLSYSELNVVVEHSITIVSFLCGTTISELRGGAKSQEKALSKWDDFPVDSTWQSLECRSLSLRTYNLSVACNVSLFSGWEPEEFTLKLLRRRHGIRHFGVHLRDRRVAGYLPNSIEVELRRQWSDISSQLPTFPDMKFDERLSQVKGSDWYKEEVEERKKTSHGTPIARYGEGDAIALCVAFSALCLHLACVESDSSVSSRMLQTSLSILLPTSQFCLDSTLWNSDIGEAASTLSGFEEWRLMTGVGPDSVVDQAAPARRRRKKAERAIEKKVQEWINGTDKPALYGYVTLPTTELNEAWRSEGNGSTAAPSQTRESMSKLHKVTEQLRACYTEMAAEKASLQVAVALLELASLPGCFNPFHCLQQAAMFASQASKSGSSDTAFRNELPTKEDCTPLQALNILGRADCLQSTFFCDEAAYLCSFVARVCRRHRDSQQWCKRWEVVAIYAFNVSVMIRTTVRTVLDKNSEKSFLSIWERDVVEELEKGRSDGWGWKRRISTSTLATDGEQKLEDDDSYEEGEFGDDDFNSSVFAEEEEENGDEDGEDITSPPIPQLPEAMEPFLTEILPTLPTVQSDDVDDDDVGGIVVVPV